MAEDLYERIKDDATCFDRGEVEVKGFGRKHIYVLEGMTDVTLPGHRR